VRRDEHFGQPLSGLVIGQSVGVTTAGRVKGPAGIVEVNPGGGVQPRS
jgi:hypothetical protein